MSYKVPTNLLSTKNSKTIKGEKQGYTTYIMYLAPHTQNSKGINLCSHASSGCATACLFNSGAARFNGVQLGKMNKTEYYLENRIGFMEQLRVEIAKIVKTHDAIVGDEQLGLKGNVIRYKKFAIRLNGTADIPFEKLKVANGLNIFELFPTAQFYDYTKNPKRFEKVQSSNYHLTFSRSETNDADSISLLKRGYNVAYVFGVKKEQDLPTTYNGFTVINGDESDLRFLDEENVIVGLKYKLMTGKGTKGKNKIQLDTNKFLIDVTENELVEV
jgi:hypothetical protein